MKPEIRVLGVDDGKFVPHSQSQARVVGIVFRGGYWLEGAMSTSISVDGFDATVNIAEMIESSPHYRQLRVVMLNGITFAGFNVVDIKELNDLTGLPIVAVTSKRPNMSEVKAALQNLPEYEKRWNAVLNAGDMFSATTRSAKQKVYLEVVGVSKPIAIEVLRLTSTRSKIPEPLRVAHLVASAMVF